MDKRLIITIPFYNNHEGLLKSIKSINESFKIDIIIADDGSETKIDEKLIRSVFKNEGNLSILNDENKTLAEFKIEIADSPYERQTGLMYRDSLEEQHGMLFIFENSELRDFYIKKYFNSFGPYLY